MALTFSYLFKAPELCILQSDSILKVVHTLPSETLVGFERICHLGRPESGLAAPDTLRTNPSNGAAFLHLRVANTTTGSPKAASVLISDVTGEAFEEARNVSEPTILGRRL